MPVQNPAAGSCLIFGKVENPDPVKRGSSRFDRCHDRRFVACQKPGEVFARIDTGTQGIVHVGIGPHLNRPCLAFGSTSLIGAG